MYTPDRFEQFIGQEEQYLQDSFLPAVVHDRDDVRLETREQAMHFYENHRDSYPFPVKDIPDTDSTFYRVVEDDMENCFFRDVFAPQYFIVDADAPADAVENADYLIAVEHRGAFTVEAQHPDYSDMARQIADQWQDEAALVWEGCTCGTFTFSMDEL